MTKLSMTVQTHPDRFEAVLFEGPFVVVRAYDNDAGVSLFLRTPADCDALIAAAVEAKRLLDPPEVVVFTDDDDDAPAPTGMQSPAPVVRVVDGAITAVAKDPCLCDHTFARHHLGPVRRERCLDTACGCKLYRQAGL